MQLPVQETHLAVERLSLGFGEKGGRVTGAHTLRLHEQEDSVRQAVSSTAACSTLAERASARYHTLYWP